MQQMLDDDVGVQPQVEPELWNLWSALHQEILEHTRQRNTILSIVMPSTVALTGASVAASAEPLIGIVIGLSAVLIAFFGSELLASSFRSIWRISTYCRVCLEPKLPHCKWETDLARINPILAGAFKLSSQARVLITLQSIGVVGALISAWRLEGRSFYMASLIICVLGFALVFRTYHEQRKYRRGGPFEQMLVKKWRE